MSAADVGFAARCEKLHRQAFEDWQDGKAIRIRKDEDGGLCITYESGRHWHYRREADGTVTWW